MIFLRNLQYIHTLKKRAEWGQRFMGKDMHSIIIYIHCLYN